MCIATNIAISLECLVTRDSQQCQRFVRRKVVHLTVLNFNVLLPVEKFLIDFCCDLLFGAASASPAYFYLLSNCWNSFQRSFVCKSLRSMYFCNVARFTSRRRAIALLGTLFSNRSIMCSPLPKSFKCSGFELPTGGPSTTPSDFLRANAYLVRAEIMLRSISAASLKATAMTFELRLSANVMCSFMEMTLMSRSIHA